MYLNNIKLTNTLYSRVKSQLSIDVKKPVNKNRSVERITGKKATDASKKSDGVYTTV
jgi:hypothetical protein